LKVTAARVYAAGETRNSNIILPTTCTSPMCQANPAIKQWYWKPEMTV
jgi:hypothetical protein